MQEALDRADVKLNAVYADQKTLWGVNAIKRWGKKPATEKQLKLVRRFCKGFNTDGLNKMEATQIINRVLNGGRAG